SLITRQSKKQDRQGASRQVKKQNKGLRRRTMQLEALEDRVVPATQSFFVDALYDPAVGGPSTGDVDHPFRDIQNALKAARLNPGPDKVYVYGNNSNDPTKAAYVWTHDEDRETDPVTGQVVGDGVIDGNMMIGDPNDPTNTVEMYFRATIRNPGS